MDRLIELLNTLPRGGLVSVDARFVSFLLYFFIFETILLLAGFTVLAAVCIRRFLKTKGMSRTIPGEEEKVRLEKIKTQMDEITRKTNNWNNYINSIFSSIDDGLVLADSDNRIVLYNPKAQALLGLNLSVFFEKRRSEVQNSKTMRTILASCKRVTARKKGEFLRLETAQGLKLEVRINPIIDKYRNRTNFGSLAIVRDVTELMRLDNLKKDFVASVSHEFRTPLTLISGFIEMFKMNDAIPPDDRKRAIEIMDIETERLKRLISELLSLSEIGNEMALEVNGPINIRTVLDDVVQSLGLLSEKKGQHFISRFSVGEECLFGNENWFYLAVKNLVENAIKYTPAGGQIILKAAAEQNAVHISVEDTGIGIERAELEPIFNRFYRVEKARSSASGGSGLGLALVKDIVGLFGGEISVESTPGKGSIFSMVLPLKHNSAPSAVTAELYND